MPGDQRVPGHAAPGRNIGRRTGVERRHLEHLARCVAHALAQQRDRTADGVDLNRHILAAKVTGILSMRKRNIYFCRKTLHLESLTDCINAQVLDFEVVFTAGTRIAMQILKLL